MRPDKSQDVELLRQQLAERDAVIAERERIIAEKETQLAERDRLIASFTSLWIELTGLETRQRLAQLLATL